MIYPTLLLLAGLFGNASAQDVSSNTTTVVTSDLSIEVSNARQDIDDIRAGKATFTGQPQFKGGFAAIGAVTFSGNAPFSGNVYGRRSKD